MNLAQRRFIQTHPLKVHETDTSQLKFINKNTKTAEKSKISNPKADQQLKKQSKYQQNTLKGLQVSVSVLIQRFQSDNDEIQNYLDLMKPKLIEQNSNNVNTQIQSNNPSVGQSITNTHLGKKNLKNQNIKHDKKQVLLQNRAQSFAKDSQIQILNKYQEANSYLFHNIQNDKIPNFHKQIQVIGSNFYQDNCRNLQKQSLNHQKNKAFCEKLKCSIMNIDQQQNEAETNDNPYFKIANSDVNIQPKLINRSKTLPIQNNPQIDNKKIDTKIQDKRLTLRDYLYMTKLSQHRQKGTSSVPNQPQSAARPSSHKKKIPASKGQVLVRIKDQISQSIKTIQKSLESALIFVQENRSIQKEQAQIMKMYSLCRIIKEQMMIQSEQLNKFIAKNTQ